VKESTCEADPKKESISEADLERRSKPDPVKESTYLTGLAVVPNAREVLLALYDKTLDELETKFQAGTPYRELVEIVTRERKTVVEENVSISVIEQIIDDGQVEELIEQAQDELELIPFMAEERPWEAPPFKQVPIIDKEY